jgi:hypothetical protein
MCEQIVPRSENGDNLRDEMTEPTCTITLYVAAVMARFLTSKLFSLIQADTIGWKYGSVIRVSFCQSVSSLEEYSQPEIIVVMVNRPHS